MPEGRTVKDSGPVLRLRSGAQTFVSFPRLVALIRAASIHLRGRLNLSL